MTSLLVIQHEPDAPPAWLGQWWTAAGVHLDVVRGDLGETIPEDTGRHDGLVVLGGAMGACDDAENTWLEPTRELLRSAVSRAVPTLGLCLGHQLLAVALGGHVGRNPSGPTIGMVPVHLNGAGRADPLLGGVDGIRTIHYNDDVVLDLPDGAVLLASLPDGRPQAVLYGPAAWGVQFHPETSPEVFESWLRWDSPEGLTADQSALLEGVSSAEEQLRAGWRPFADRFVALLGSASVTAS